MKRLACYFTTFLIAITTCAQNFEGELFIKVSTKAKYLL